MTECKYTIGATQTDMDLSHGEMKREIAAAVGCDPDRYAEDVGNERHKRLTRAELVGVAETLGLGFLADESKQQLKDSILLKLGRDHRTGCGVLDAADLRTIYTEVVTDD